MLHLVSPGGVVEEGMAIGRQVHAAYVKALRAL